MKHAFYFLITLLFLAASCTSEKDGNGKTKLSPDAINNPISASDKKGKEKLPVFKFDKTNHAFGQIMEGESVSYEFEFTNVGNSDLIINSVSSTCGCTIPEYSKEPVAPNKKGIIKVVFNSKGKTGMNSKNITVIANTIPNSKILTISADVIAN